MTHSNIFSKATRPVVTKFYVETPAAEGTKSVQTDHDTLPTWQQYPYGKTFKIFSFETSGAMALKSDIWHDVPRLFNDLGLTLTFLWQGQIWNIRI